MIEKGVVLPMFYLPPVEYFTMLNNYKPGIWIEASEHFPKQTYRNRANIYSPDGVLALTVPVIKGSKAHTKVKDVRISYDFNWQRLHWLSLQACYRRSAYFEFYEDDLAPFYESKYAFLFDYNEHLLHFILKAIKLKTPLKYTLSFAAEYPLMEDFRHVINPKKENEFNQKHYLQVFDGRLGFQKNLSIVDLLFNQGPHSVNYL